jgi:hypothetical protein
MFRHAEYLGRNLVGNVAASAAEGDAKISELQAERDAKIVEVQAALDEKHENPKPNSEPPRRMPKST